MGGDVAVKAFYIISGFYMSMVLTTKYLKKKNGYKIFITNRALRLYPTYWAVLLGAVGLSLVSLGFTGSPFKLAPYFAHFDEFNLTTFCYFIFTNIFIFGQDLSSFLEIDQTGALAFTSNFWPSSPKVLEFLLVPPAWTIGVELMFYLKAPFLVKRSNLFLAVLCAISIGWRLYFYQIGYDFDPWTYRFYPFELLFFLLGIFSHRIYQVINFEQIQMRSLGYATHFILLFTFLYQFVPFDWKDTLYLILITTLLPFIFQYSKNDRLDRKFGEYSYPIYISHFLVASIIMILRNALNIPWEYMSELTIIACFAASYILIVWLIDPIESVRAKIAKKNTPSVSVKKTEVLIK